METAIHNLCKTIGRVRKNHPMLVKRYATDLCKKAFEIWDYADSCQYSELMSAYARFLEKFKKVVNRLPPDSVDRNDLIDAENDFLYMVEHTLRTKCGCKVPSFEE